MERKPTIEEMREAWERVKREKAARNERHRRYLDSHPEQRVKGAARSRKRYAEMMRLAELAKEAGLG